LIDPNTAPLRALPRENRDLFITGTNGHVLAFDNISGLPPWISDALCRLSTGGGFSARALYTDQDEVLFDAQRPIILNGIEDIVERPDLADRALIQTLEPIAEECRRPEAEIWAKFERERPWILGALLDAVVHGFKMLPLTKLNKLPRMADFALFATACETAIWPAGTFMAAYCSNRDAMVEDVIDADPIGAAVRSLMAGTVRTEWTGTASELLVALAKVVDERVSKSKNWPGSPQALSGRLRRAATFLRKIGIEVSHSRQGRGRNRLIHIVKTPNVPTTECEGARPSAPSAPNRSAVPSPGTPAKNADDTADGSVTSIVREDLFSFNAADYADDADANSTSRSGVENSDEWESAI
jgi:hypothetical protein